MLRVYFSTQKGIIKEDSIMKPHACKNVPARYGVGGVLILLSRYYWYSHLVGRSKVQQKVENMKGRNIIALEGSGLIKLLPQYASALCS